MKRRTSQMVVAVPAALTAALLLAGCLGDKNTEPWKDAGRTAQENDGKAQVITMPDGFNNLATKCAGDGLRVFTSYHGDGSYGSITVAVDPACTTSIPQR